MRHNTAKESVFAPARNGGAELVRYSGDSIAVVPAFFGDLPVTSIGPGAFSGLPIISVTLPEGVNSIGREAFSGCTRLRSIQLPHSLRAIGASAFLRCSALEAFSL